MGMRDVDKENEENIELNEKKTYGWLIIVLVVTVLLNILTAIVGEGAIEGITFDAIYIDKLVYIQYGLMLILVGWKVKATGRVYWISSHTYSDYLKMSDEKRGQIADTFYQIVLKYCVGVIVFSIMAMIIKLSVMVSTLIFTVLMIAMAIHSMVAEMKRGRK